jgi:hypothetical protein
MIFKDQKNKPYVPKKDWKTGKPKFNNSKPPHGDNLPIKRAEAPAKQE